MPEENTAVQHWSPGNVDSTGKKKCEEGMLKFVHQRIFMICCSEICVHLVLRDSGVLFRDVVLYRILYVGRL